MFPPTTGFGPPADEPENQDSSGTTFDFPTGPPPDGWTLPFSYTLPPVPSPEPPRPILPDTVGRYRIVGELARGAMGVVYLGRDAGFDRDVAVKVLLDAHLGKSEFRRRFAEEARITANLQHPGIIPVYEAGEFPDGRPYYAMRLMTGRTLADVLAARANVHDDRSRLLKVFEKVCETLAYTHAQGVIHRDIKPDNVMLGEYGRVKVMDWGVAKVLPDSPLAGPPGDPDPPPGEPPSQADAATGHTRLGRVSGTPAYMAPEQARGCADQLDERTADVFGLGGLLCAVLTGRPPYTGDNTRVVYRKAVRAELADAFARLDGCGAEPELAALCKRCLAADPADRPRDAGLLAAELTEYLNYDLRRSERDLVRFFELSLDLFCIAGLDGYFRRVNANFARVLGYTTAELLNTPFMDFVHPDDRARTRAEVAQLSRGRPCVRFLNRYRDTRGGYRRFEWTAKSIPEEGVIFAVARDVTDWIRVTDDG